MDSLSGRGVVRPVRPDRRAVLRMGQLVHYYPEVRGRAAVCLVIADHPFQLSREPLVWYESVRLI